MLAIHALSVTYACNQMKRYGFIWCSSRPECIIHVAGSPRSTFLPHVIQLVDRRRYYACQQPSTPIVVLQALSDRLSLLLTDGLFQPRMRMLRSSIQSDRMKLLSSACRFGPGEGCDSAKSWQGRGGEPSWPGWTFVTTILQLSSQRPTCTFSVAVKQQSAFSRNLTESAA